MSHVEKEKLIKADIASIENRVRHAFNQGYDLGFKDGKERAKALEQEPILEKISAEIENDWQLKKYPSSPFSCGLRRAIEIIDKYKVERDDKPEERKERELRWARRADEESRVARMNGWIG